MAEQTQPGNPGPSTAGLGGLRIALLLVWAGASFGFAFFARDLQTVVAGWPFNFWFAAQGAVLVFIVILAGYAWVRNRQPGEAASVITANAAYRGYKRQLHRILARYVAYFLAFLALMVLAERAGLSKAWIGAIFLLATVLLYATIGIYCRTADADEYYVAGRHVAAMYNGMATAADWMSAAFFISLAGGSTCRASPAPKHNRAGWPISWDGPAGFAWSAC